MHYQLSFSRLLEHLIDVELSFVSPVADPVLTLPAWIPGSYLVREFSRHFGELSYSVAGGDFKKASKCAKNQWVLSGVQASDQITVRYEVYAFDLSVRGSYVDQTRIYINPCTLCVSVDQLKHSQHTLEYEVPEVLRGAQSKLACALSNASTLPKVSLKAKCYETLIDSPFELSDQLQGIFQANQINHSVYVSGCNQLDMQRLTTDLQKLCSTYLEWLKAAPFEDYVFMTHATLADYGGLEHQASTSLITPVADLPLATEPKQPSSGYQRFLGLCSHEYFHSWWVKQVRPAEFRAPDLSTESYTKLLWVFEGFTSYIDDLMLLRSGLIETKDYFKLLEAQIKRYFATPGRTLQAVTDSSYDAWIKLYRADENTANAGASYYNVGALAALCLDLLLLQHKASITDVVLKLIKQAKQGTDVTPELLDQVIGQLMPIDTWLEFKAAYIDQASELPLAKLLETSGVELKTKPYKLENGLILESSAEGLLVKRVYRGSAASKAGISAMDVLVVANGFKASESMLTEALTKGSAVKLGGFRKGRWLEFELHAQALNLSDPELCIQDPVKAASWLKAKA